MLSFSKVGIYVSGAFNLTTSPNLTPVSLGRYPLFEITSLGKCFQTFSVISG